MLLDWQTGWVWMCIAMVVLWGFVIWFVITLVRQFGRRGGRERGALKDLDDRFAKGEIDDDFRRRSGLVRL